MAREKNSEEQRKFKTKGQKNNEQKNNEIAREFNISDTKNLKLKLRNKLKLAIEQNFTCLYCGEKFDRDSVLNDEIKYEIDHIIPESVSFDSSMENKVLVHATENAKKGKRTAYQYILSSDSKLSMQQFVALIGESYKESFKNVMTKKYMYRKKDNFLNEIDINDINSVNDFISKNINDTRYATAEIKRYIHAYKDASKLNFKIETMNGKFTNYLRMQIFDLGKKDRDVYSHHAMDAIMIALSPDVRRQLRSDKDKKDVINYFRSKKSEILNYTYSFSKMPNSKINKQLFDETIYSFRKDENDEYKKIVKLDLFSEEKSDLDKFKDIFVTGKLKSLIEESDAKTFKFLKSVYSEYEGIKFNKEGKEFIVKNPFLYARDELKIDITTKKSGNPETECKIKSIRFYEDKMGKVLDITHKFKNVKNKIIGMKKLAPIRIRVFKNKITNMFRCISLDSSIIKNIKMNIIKTIDNEMYLKRLEKAKINTNEYDHLFDLNPRGSLIYIKNKIFTDGIILELVGTPNDNMIEFSFIDRKQSKISAEKYGTVTTFSEFKKVYTNVLGNKTCFVEKETKELDY